MKPCTQMHPFNMLPDRLDFRTLLMLPEALHNPLAWLSNTAQV